MKYIDAELLETELKRRIKERDNMMKLGTYFSTSYVYEDILDLIASLQQEQPKGDLAENIEMEWDSFNKNVAVYGEESEDVVWLNWFSFTDVATYFYELGLNARKKK